jgi:ribonuclease BN (tRNA processing enzyme)
MINSVSGEKSMIEQKNGMRALINILMVFTFILFSISVSYGDTTFTILGTQGGPITAPKRGQPSNLLTVNGMQTLVDVGDGTASRISRLRLQAMDIDNILISHLHFDHTGGLLAIIGLRFQTNSPKPIQIYGPPGTDVLVAGIMARMAPAMEANYGMPGETTFTAKQLVNTHVIRAGDTFSLGDTKISVAKNTHYSFPPGSLKDKKFQSLSFRFETPDKTIVYTGDTGPSTDVEKLAKGVDLLVGEMIDIDLTMKIITKANPGFPKKRLEFVKIHLSSHHLAPGDLGKLAAKAGAKELVVTHLVPGGAMRPEQVAAYTKEIAAEFSGKVTIANDMDRF